MRSDAAIPVAVVGGGFSGVMTAVQLARRGVLATIFDGGAIPGRGVAYSTRDPNHLLNVPAAKMSAFPADPDDFQRWSGETPNTFVPRMHFGRYLDEIRAAHGDVTLEPVAVTRIDRDGDAWRLALGDGREVTASAVVLALGNEAPALPRGWEGVPILANPWSAEAPDLLARVVEENGELLLIGTGLTMVDLILTMDGLGYEGRITAVSRRGLMPRAHAPHDPAPVTLEEVPQGNLGALSSWLRRRSGEVGFRAAVDSLRPHTGALWQALPLEQRRRFLRHARPWWDVHRHRIAPQVAERLRELIGEGRLEIVAGRLAERKDGVVTIATRGGGTRTVRPSLVVNCTGPLGDVRGSRNPLLRQLLEDGLVRPDPLYLGLEGDAQDRVAPGMWAAGPLTKGMYWEMIAVPDIRHQAERVASAITEELATHG